MIVISPEGEQVSGLSSEYFTTPLDCHLASFHRPRRVEENNRGTGRVEARARWRQPVVAEARAKRGSVQVSARVRGAVRAAIRGTVRADILGNESFRVVMVSKKALLLRDEALRRKAKKSKREG